MASSSAQESQPEDPYSPMRSPRTAAGGQSTTKPFQTVTSGAPKAPAGAKASGASSREPARPPTTNPFLVDLTISPRTLSPLESRPPPKLEQRSISPYKLDVYNQFVRVDSAEAGTSSAKATAANGRGSATVAVGGGGSTVGRVGPQQRASKAVGPAKGGSAKNSARNSPKRQREGQHRSEWGRYEDVAPVSNFGAGEDWDIEL